jgi:hypothetical protein
VHVVPGTDTREGPGGEPLLETVCWGLYLLILPLEQTACPAVRVRRQVGGCLRGVVRRPRREGSLGLHGARGFQGHVSYLRCANNSPCSARCTFEHGVVLPALATACGTPLRRDGLLGDEARKRGIELPLPFGAGLVFYHLSRDIEITNLSVGRNGAPPTSVSQFVQLGSHSRVDNVNVKLDAWLLPFVNLYAIAGYISCRVPTPATSANSETRSAAKANGWGRSFSW